jgi:hypothetical protein
MTVGIDERQNERNEKIKWETRRNLSSSGTFSWNLIECILQIGLHCTNQKH